MHFGFCTHIDLCVVHLHFLHGMNLQFSTIAVRMYLFMFYMQICAYFAVRVISIGVEFVLDTNLVTFIWHPEVRWEQYADKETPIWS